MADTIRELNGNAMEGYDPTPTPRKPIKFIENLLPSLLLGAAKTLSLNAPGKFTGEEDVCRQAAERIAQLQRDLAAAQSVERERCAKIVEQYSVEIDGMPGTSRSLKPLADVIRSGQ